MLSDEITTGSVNTTDADKRAWARKSHSWNLQQRKFKEAFPEVCCLQFLPRNSLIGSQYCTSTMRDLPNMGESARRGPSDPTSSRLSQQHQVVEQARAVPASQPGATPQPTTEAKTVAEASEASGGWADLIWQKWRWGLFIAIAVIVSRLSSS